MSRITKLTIVAAPLALAGIIAFAATTMENDAAPLIKAKISLSQAITNAEQQTGGKAVRAEFEHTKSGWAYDVEIVAGDKTLDVRVSPDTGTVVAVVEDKVDRDDAHDAKD